MPGIRRARHTHVCDRVMKRFSKAHSVGPTQCCDGDDTSRSESTCDHAMYTRVKSDAPRPHYTYVVSNLVAWASARVSHVPVSTPHRALLASRRRHATCTLQFDTCLNYIFRLFFGHRQG